MLLAQLRQQSYADFLKAVANAARNRTADVLTQAADAKARMAIYGSNSVLEKLAVFEELGASLTDDASRRAFATMTEQMRAESSSNSSRLQDGVLARVLFQRVLAKVAVEDGFAETFKDARGKIDPKLKLGF